CRQIPIGMHGRAVTGDPPGRGPQPDPVRCELPSIPRIEVAVFLHVQRMINEIVPDEPDPAAANALQEGLGGQVGEMRTMMPYLFQSFNFRGNAKPYRDLIQGIGVEEISHVELIATTITRLLDGSPRYKGDGTPGEGGSTPLNMALSQGNIQHYLVGAQGAMPVDAAGNPW